MKITIVALLAVVAAGVPACGGRSADFAAEEVVGTYVLDLEKTMAARPAKAGDVADAALHDRLQAAFDPSRYRLVLEPDRTYRFRMGEGDGAVDVVGDWTPNLGGLALTPREAAGEPVPPEDQVPETVAQDGPWLVLSDGGEPVYLRRP